MKKLLFPAIVLFIILFLIKPVPSYADSTQMHIIEFTNSSSGYLVRVFLSPLPDGVTTDYDCILYDHTHTIINSGNVMNPPNGCFFGTTIPDGQYTIEILNRLNDVNSPPIGVSDPFYMINGVASIQPPISPTPTPENLAPQIYAPQYLVLNTGNTYYVQGSFIDGDSTSWTATVDYGDGSGQQPLPLSGFYFLLQHQYTTNGTFIVTINVTDEHGNTGTVNGIVAIVPTPAPASSLTISNINYFYTSPNTTTLTISFAPDVSFPIYGCALVVNNNTARTASSTTSDSCTFSNSGFSFDYSNISLYLYDRQQIQTARTNSVFYTTTQLLSETGVQFNQNALVINTSLNKVNEPCYVQDQRNTTVAQANSFIGNTNSCVFIGYGTNGPQHVPDGTYRLYFPSSGLTSNLFTITNPIPPQLTTLASPTVTIGDAYTDTGSFTDSDSTSWTATVDYGDGPGSQPLSLSGNTFSLSHQYASVGTYAVNVNVTDNHGITGTATATITVINPPPTTLVPVADSYIKQGNSNENEGASTFMRLQNSGNNRAMVKFDESQIQSAVGSSQNYTATLQFTITGNGNNWGNHGRAIELHRLTNEWTEGNGFIDGNSPANRGTGSGTTWSCATDSNIHNSNSDCNGSTAWNMTSSSLWPFASAVTASSTITNNQTGTVSFNVTSDVQSFLNGSNQNYGWLLKKIDEGVNGRVEFGSKESSSGPQLIITKN